MRATTLTLAVATACAACHVIAQCSGGDKQLTSIVHALDQENAAEAETFLDSFRRSNPDCPEILLYTGRILSLQGEESGAEDALTRYIQHSPEDARGYAYIGRLYLEEERYSKADFASQVAMQKDSFEPAAIALRGQILGMKDEVEPAIALLERACGLDPKDAQCHFQLGSLYNRERRRVEASREFKEAVALLPNNAQAWDYLALNLEPLGQIDLAEEAYRRGEGVNQQGRHYDGFLDYNYGRFLAKLNRLNDAKQHLDRAVELAPDVRAVWYERARVYLAMRNYPSARADGEKAASLADPRGVILDLQLYALLEEVYRRLGETELANKYGELSRKTPGPVQQSRD